MKSWKFRTKVVSIWGKNASLESYRRESKVKDLGGFAKSLWQVSVQQDFRVLNKTLQITLLGIQTDISLPFDIDWDLKFWKLDCSLWTGCYLIWKYGISSSISSSGKSNMYKQSSLAWFRYIKILAAMV